MNSQCKELIEEITTESSQSGKNRHRVFRLGRLANPQAPEWGRPQDQDLVLLEDQGLEGGDPLAEEAVEPEQKVGLTGTYSSRLFGSSTRYFAHKIRNK